MDEWKQTAGPEIPENSSDPGSVAPVREEPARTEPLKEWSKVRELALRQLDRFISLEPKVLRGDDADAIHDIRVASRRLQQVLDLLYPDARQKEVRRLRRRIRRCRRALGEVRNCDVMLDAVNQSLARKRAARREAWTAVRHYLLERRAGSFQQAMRKLSKVNLAVLYVRLKDLLATEGAAAEPAPSPEVMAFPDQPTSDQFPQRLAQSLEGVWEAFQKQVAESQRDARGSVIHTVRIAAKRLRYLIEVIHEFEVTGSAEALTWLRGLQQHLGDWHDLEVLEQMVVDMVARPAFLREHLELAMEVQKLILRGRVEKKDFEGKYFAMTRDTPEWQGLKDWVAHLLESPSAAFARA
jgi:CHAD domain-containing protein